MRVLVFGCGPAGLLAAHAAAILDHDILILSDKPRPSHLNGCQYLHAPIPHLTVDEPIMVDYRLDGTPAGYREKVYGPNWAGLVSVESLDEKHLAWDLRQAYRDLWGMYGSYVQESVVGGPEDVRYQINLLSPDVILSTVPRTALCQGDHRFDAEAVWALGDMEGGRVIQYSCPEDTVVCDGTPDTGWYRKARVFGHTTVEWPWNDGKKPPIDGVARVIKPLASDCDCHEQHSVPVHLLGRYGRWEKGVLSHSAFYETFGHLANVSHQQTLPGL